MLAVVGTGLDAGAQVWAGNKVVARAFSNSAIMRGVAQRDTFMLTPQIWQPTIF